MRRVIFHSSYHLLGGWFEKKCLFPEEKHKKRFCLQVDLLLRGKKEENMSVSEPAIRREFSLSRSCFLFLLSPLSHFLSFSVHTETEVTRQMIPSTTNGHASRSTESRESCQSANQEPCMVKLCFVVCVARFSRPSGPYQPSCLASEGTARGASSQAKTALHTPQGALAILLRPCFAGMNEQKEYGLCTPP